jgi:hypothetical protein
MSRDLDKIGPGDQRATQSMRVGESKSKGGCQGSRGRSSKQWQKRENHKATASHRGFFRHGREPLLPGVLSIEAGRVGQ